MSQSLRMNFLRYLQLQHRDELLSLTPELMPVDFLQMISQIIITSTVDSYEPNNKNYFKSVLNSIDQFNQGKQTTNNLDSMWDASSNMIEIMFENYQRSSSFIDNVKSIREGKKKKKRFLKDKKQKKSHSHSQKNSEQQLRVFSRTNNYANNFPTDTVAPIIQKIRKHPPQIQQIQQLPEIIPQPNVQPQLIPQQSPKQLVHIKQFIQQLQQPQAAQQQQQLNQRVGENTSLGMKASNAMIHPQQIIPQLKAQQINNSYDQYQNLVNPYSQFSYYPIFNQAYQHYTWQNYKSQ